MQGINKAGIPPRNINGLAYQGAALSLLPVISLTRNPTTNDNQFPLNTFAINIDENDVDYGSLWYLSYFDAQVSAESNAIWIRLSDGNSGPLVKVAVPLGTSPVHPDSNGLMTFTSAGGTIDITGTTNAINFDLAGGGQAVDSFTVPSGTSPVVPDANGNIDITAGTGITVTGGLNTYQIGLTGSGIAIDSINVDASSGTGTDPVVPDSNGQITVTGGQIATGTIGANVIRSISTAANSYTMQIQQTDCVSMKDTTKNGVAHFNSGHFSDDEGFISILNYVAPTVFTPSVEGGTVAGSPTITVANGVWSRIGPIVNIQFEITWTALNSASGDLIITGFPVQFGSGSLNRNPLGTIWLEGLTWPVGTNYCVFEGNPSTTTGLIWGILDASTPSAVQIGANATIHGNITFSLPSA